MKFDVVIGNPPYHKVVGESRISIAHLFAKKMYDCVASRGYLALVNSNSGLSAGQNNSHKIFNDNTIMYVSPTSDGKKYFPGIGIGISVYVLCKDGTKAQDIIYSNKGETFTIQKSDYRFHYDDIGYIPVDVVSSDLAPLKKIISYSDDTFQFRGSLRKSNPRNETYFFFNTSNKIFVAPSRFGVEYGVSNIGHPCAVTGRIEEPVLKSVFCSYIFHWLIERIMGPNASCRPSGVSYFPKIPLTKVYTHDDLAKLFDLTKEESDYIISWANTKPANYWSIYHNVFEKDKVC